MKPRKVSKLGVQYRDQFYTHHRLAPHIGRGVTIEPLPEAPARLAVYDRRGELICEAYRQRELPPEITVAILLERGDLRAQDRRWWRRLLTEIEVDTRERHRAAQPRADEGVAAGTSLVEALFGRLPVNQAAPPPTNPTTREPPHDMPLPSETRPRPETHQGALNRPAPPRKQAIADELAETADA